MNLQTQQWDKDLLDFFKIPAAILPTIKSSAEFYGKMVRNDLSQIQVLDSMRAPDIFFNFVYLPGVKQDSTLTSFYATSTTSPVGCAFWGCAL